MHFGNLDHDCLIMRGVTREGVRREVRFWAERGLIHYEDSLDNSYGSMSVGSFLHRLKALNDMLANGAVSSDRGADAHLREETQRTVERACDVVRKAQEQGMPEDASARRDLVRRRPRTVCVTDPRAVM